MDLISASARTDRRIRLRFNQDVGAGGYVTTLYTVESQDVTAASPGLRAVYAIAGIPAMVELVLDSDLIPSGIYKVFAENVPSTTLELTPVGNFENFVFGTPTTAPINAEPKQSNGETVLYGRDLIFSGDFQETVEGDLASVTGIVNAQQALFRRLTGAPLPYAPSYSPNAREFVDGNDSLVLKNRIRQQATKDNRVQSIQVKLETDAAGRTVYVIDPTFIGNRQTQSFNVQY